MKSALPVLLALVASGCEAPLVPLACRPFVSIAPTDADVPDGASSLWVWDVSSSTELRSGLLPHGRGVPGPGRTHFAYSGTGKVIIAEVLPGGDHPPQVFA